VGPGEFPDLSRRETLTLSDDYFDRHSAYSLLIAGPMVKPQA
jgi:hypothetical protein